MRVGDILISGFFISINRVCPCSLPHLFKRLVKIIGKTPSMHWTVAHNRWMIDALSMAMIYSYVAWHARKIIFLSKNGLISIAVKWCLSMLVLEENVIFIMLCFWWEYVNLKWQITCQVLEIIHDQIVESWSSWCTQHEQL